MSATLPNDDDARDEVQALLDALDRELTFEETMAIALKAKALLDRQIAKLEAKR